ncbi:MAG: glutamate--tRNA ligase [Candidatus Sungbacteria bacterium]|nr:glutamate--tRNA ligase [Candidatus Sungbacteria bacterium]
MHKMSTLRVRIPPSPTGSPHVGNARTALFNYAFAKHHGGAFIVRIEDTDIARSEKKYEQEILEGFRWLGIIADESPEVGGPYAPYRQSERTHVYKPYLDRLLQEGIAFYCFHTKEELDRERTTLIAEKKSPLHRCSYRDTRIADALVLAEKKPESVIRFRVPLGRSVSFRDLIRGQLRFETDVIEDFSLARNPDAPLYNFVVTIDDALMKISHVIRGEEHTTNTPKQILLAEALDFPIPEFAHLPLILGQDRSKLSKRHGAMSVLEYRQQGYLPEALFNFIALLGWHPKDDREILTKDEIIAEFSLERVQKSGAIFDFQKLDWMNGEYIRRKSVDELAMLCRPYLEHFLASTPQKTHPDKLENVGVSTSRTGGDILRDVVALEQPRLKKLSEIGERAEYFFRPPAYTKELLRWKNMTDAEILDSLKRSENIFSDIGNKLSSGQTIPANELAKDFLAQMGEKDRGALLWPLRVALCGKKASPGPFEIAAILGIQESLARIRDARHKLAE